MLDPQLQEIIDLESRGYQSTALTRLKQYLREKPGSADGWYYLARFERQPRQQLKAVDHALKLQPDHRLAQTFRTGLIEEYPWLTPRFFTREVRLVLLLITLLVAVSGAVAIFLMAEDTEPQIVVLEPTITPTLLATDTPEIIIVTATPTPTATLITVPTLTPAAASPTFAPQETSTPENTFIAAPTAIPINTPAPVPTLPPVDDLARVVVIIPFENDSEDLATRLAAELSTAFSDSLYTFSVGENSQAMVTISGSLIGDQLDLTVRVNADETNQRADVLALVRPAAPWEITQQVSIVDLSSNAAIRAVLAYMQYDHQSVIATLADRYRSLGRSLDEADVQLALLLAYSYQAVGDHDAALPLYDLLNGYSTERSIRANRAMAVAQAQNAQSGVDMYLTLLPDYPDPDFIQTNIGVIYAGVSGSENAALLAFEEAMQLDPTAARPYVERARLRDQQGDTNAAVTDLNSAIELDPNYAPAYTERARLLMAQNRLSEALMDINRAIEIAPLVGTAYALQGMILAQQEHWQETAIALDKAVRLEKQNADVYAAFGQALNAIGDHNNAIRQINITLTLDANSITAWVERGKAYVAQNELGSALNDFTEAINRDPQNVEWLVLRCATYAQAGNDGLAAADCDSALLLDPQNGFALEQRGMIRARAGDRAGAASDFIEALTYESQLYEARYYLGLYALQEGRYTDAIEHLNTAIQINSSLGKAYAARGVTYRIMEQWQQAMVDLEQALAFAPDDTYNYYELGMVKRRLADLAFEGGNRTQAETLYSEAETAFSRFIEANVPNNPYMGQALAGQSYVQQALRVIRGN